MHKNYSSAVYLEKSHTMLVTPYVQNVSPKPYNCKQNGRNKLNSPHVCPKLSGFTRDKSSLTWVPQGIPSIFNQEIQEISETLSGDKIPDLDCELGLIRLSGVVYNIRNQHHH